MKRNDVQVFFRISREDHAWVKRQAKTLGVGVGDVVRMMVRLVRLGLERAAEIEVPEKKKGPPDET